MDWTANLTRRVRRRLGMGRSALVSDFSSRRQALIVHGLHKSATMFLFKFFDDICRQIDVPVFSIHNSPPDDQRIPANTNSSFVLCPVRSFSIAEATFENLESIHLFQTRDPRDILVSEYYSLGWRHSDREWDASERERRERIQDLSIDQYVVQEPDISKYPLLDRYQVLLEAMGQSQVCLAKYETMILDFERWLSQVIPLLGLTRESDRSFLLNRYRDEFRPDPDPNAHKRNVLPGDHRQKLQPETIELLNIRFATVLDALDYD